MEKQTTIYFLEWIEENYGIEPISFLNNCEIENKYIRDLLPFDKYEKYPEDYIFNAFSWENSSCIGIKDSKEKGTFFAKMDTEWNKITNEHEVLFSRKPIKNFKLLSNDFKLKFM